jgi:hypothetical protein
MHIETIQRFLSFLGAFVALWVLSIPILAQSAASSGKSVEGAHMPKTPKVYEDREIRVDIPQGWQIASTGDAKKKSENVISLGNSVSQPEGGLVLEKEGYALAIAYNTGQASGIEGGRFIEVFSIAWPGVEDEWSCSGYLHYQSQPASRILIFENVIVDDMDPKGIEICGLSKMPGAWEDKNGMKRRWFGGYFTTADGGYFFDSDGDGCGEKAYTLTSQEEIPEKLPLLGDPGLKKMIQEAIDIVNSIHYKKCAPAP